MRGFFIHAFTYSLNPYLCPVKLFLKFFLLYFLSLALLPCNESLACANTGRANTEIASQQKEHSQDHEDDCPPLCSCTCCNHALVKYLNYNAISRQVFQPRNFTFHFDASTADMHYPIWQPPQS